MRKPIEPGEDQSSFWQTGPKTRLHRYFYPSDDRLGFALMLLIGVLGLIALGFGLRNVFGSPAIERRDEILSGIGVITADVGLYQAYRLRPLD